MLAQWLPPFLHYDNYWGSGFVGWLVGWLVGWFVGWLVGWLALCGSDFDDCLILHSGTPLLFHPLFDGAAFYAIIPGAMGIIAPWPVVPPASSADAADLPDHPVHCLVLLPPRHTSLRAGEGEKAFAACCASMPY